MAGRPARRLGAAASGAEPGRRRRDGLAADGPCTVRAAGPPPGVGPEPLPGVGRPITAASAPARHRRPDPGRPEKEETMSTHDNWRVTGGHPGHGQVCYLQLPTTDLAASIAFYTAVFGWRGEPEFGSFEAPGLIGQWTDDLTPAPGSGPVLWLGVDQLWPALIRVVSHGGHVE